MAIYFISTTAIFLYGVLTNANTTQRKRKRFILVSFGILILIAALRAPTVGIDLNLHYLRNYKNIVFYDWGSVPEFGVMTGYEIGYCYFIKLLSVINPAPQFYIIICSIIIYTAFGYFIYKESDDVIMSTMLMIFTCTYYMCMNIIRQSLAVSIILVGYTLLDHSNRTTKDYIKFTLWIALASTFHDSAILCLSMILFDRLKFTRKQILLGMVVVAGLYMLYDRAYSLLVGLMGFGDNNYERYITSLTEGAGSINTQSIINMLLTLSCFLLGFYILVWNRKTIKTFRTVEDNRYSLTINESFMLFMVLIATACRLLIFRMNIINRFTYYFIPFLFILYPHAINSAALKNNRRILRLLVYAAFGLYFVWMTIEKAESFYGSVPYHFFWSMR